MSKVRIGVRAVAEVAKTFWGREPDETLGEFRHAKMQHVRPRTGGAQWENVALAVRSTAFRRLSRIKDRINAALRAETAPPKRYTPKRNSRSAN